jgi:hypothetical protein
MWFCRQWLKLHVFWLSAIVVHPGQRSPGAGECEIGQQEADDEDTKTGKKPENDPKQGTQSAAMLRGAEANPPAMSRRDAQKRCQGGARPGEWYSKEHWHGQYPG